MIEHLFTKGKSTSAFPIKLLYDFVDLEPFYLQAGVTVSTRKFKKAVDRNRVKRMMRESYRLQKTELEDLLTGEKKGMALFFIYLGNDLPIYKDVHDKMGVLLQRLVTELDKKKSKD
jgi:ribonuclease P protein component